MELKKYRRIAGLTQGELAKKSGVDVTLISRLERGERQTASYESIVRLARALNLEPEELMPVDFSAKEGAPRANA
jgi:transcriptional regulator with XRE-family HTH domain